MKAVKALLVLEVSLIFKKKKNRVLIFTCVSVCVFKEALLFFLNAHL